MASPASARIGRAAIVARRMARGIASARRESFVTSAPSAQTAIDAVPDAWASKFPPPLDRLHAGQAPLFEDPRIAWAFERLGGLDGMSVLDLGPLEGAHSYMAIRAGAARTVGIEANRLAFLKCLVTKELLDLRGCSFQCGDVNEYLSATSESFDVCIASGLLYHMAEPVRLIELISKVASRLVMWTHVFDAAATRNPNLAGKLGPARETAHNGFQHRVHRHSYGFDSRLGGFFGGTQSYSNWLPREDLLRALAHFGWRDIEVAFDDPMHANGPSLALVALRD